MSKLTVLDRHAVIDYTNLYCNPRLQEQYFHPLEVRQELDFLLLLLMYLKYCRSIIRVLFQDVDFDLNQVSCFL